MPEENSSATYHLSELDFDISKIPNQLQDIDDLISQYVQNYQNQFSGVRFDFDTHSARANIRELNELIENQKDATAKYSTSRYSVDPSLKQASKLLEEQLETLKKQVQTNEINGNKYEENLETIIKQSRELNRQAEFDLPVQTVKTTWADKLKQAFAIDLIDAAEDAVRYTVETLKDVEFEVMEITRVLGDATLNTKEYTQSLFDIATEYGRQFSDVTEVTLRFAQSGYNAAESLEMARTTMLALNTAELSVEQSTNSLIGIMKQWDMQTSEFSLLVDKINLAADSYAVTSQDLVDGLLRSSSAAANAKFSFDEAIGALVAMRETSGRTGKEVGTAMNSLITYTQRAKSLAVFEDLGVKVYADETKETLMPVLSIWEKLSKLVNENGDAVVTTLEKYTDMSNLMNEEVAAATGTLDEYNAALEAQQATTKEGLSDMERQAIYEQAGTHRRNYFIALLKNFGRIQDVVTTLQDAEGHSMRENAKYMDTLTARYNTFISTLQELAQAAGDSGLTGLAKDILSIATSMVEMGESFASVPMITAGATALFGVINKESKLTSKFLGNNIKSLDDLVDSFSEGKGVIGSFISGLVNMDAAQIEASVSSVALKASTLALNAAISAGISLLVMYAVKGLAYLINYSENVREEFDNLTYKMEETSSSFRKNVSDITSMKNRYAELAQGVDKFGENLRLTDEEYEEYLEKSNKLAKILPQIVIGTDENGNAILNLKGNVDEIKASLDRYIETLRGTKNKEILAGADEAFESHKKVLNESNKELEKLRKKQEEIAELPERVAKKSDYVFSAGPELDRYTAKLKELGVQFDVIDQKYKRGWGSGFKVVIDEDAIETASLKIDKSISDLENRIKLDFSKLNPVIQATVEGHVKYYNLSEEVQRFFKEVISKEEFASNAELQEWVDSMIGKFEDATPAMQGAIIDLFSLEESVKNGEITVEAYKASIKNALEKLKTLIPDDVFQALLDQYLGVGDSVQAAAEAAANKTKTLKDVAIEQLGDINEAIKNLNSEIDTMQSSFQTLADVVGEYNTQGYVSVDTLQKLISLSPNYLALLSEENGSLLYNEDAYRRVIAAEIEKMRVDALNNIARQISDIDSESAALGILEGEYLSAASSAENLTKAILDNIVALEQQGTVTAGTANKLVDYINTINAVFDKAKENENNYKPPEFKAPTVSGGGGTGKSWYDSQVEAFERLNRMGQKNTQQVVDFYRQMTKSANVSAADRIKAEEKLFDAIKKQIQESLKAQIETLNKQKEAIQDRAEEQVDELNDRKQQIEDEAQAEIDALQKVQDERDRQRDYEEYQQKLHEAKLDLAAAQRRSGIDARRAEAEALDKIDEINRDWQEKVEDWSIEDRIAEIERYRDAEIASIEAQIDAVNEQKEADIEAIDEAIDHLNEQFSEANINMMAYASMTSEQLYNQYVGEFIEPMANGLFDGFLQANDLMESAAASNASNLANIYRSEFVNPMREEIANLQTQAESIKLGPYLSDTYQLKAMPNAEYERRQSSRTYNVNMTNNNNISNGADINRMTKGILRAIGSALTGKP